MRLFPKVDGTIDRFDRAAILSVPFSIAWTVTVTGPLYFFHETADPTRVFAFHIS